MQYTEFRIYEYTIGTSFNMKKLWWQFENRRLSARVDIAYYISDRVINCFRIETSKYLTKRNRALNPRGCLAIPRVSIRQKLEKFQSSLTAIPRSRLWSVGSSSKRGEGKPKDDDESTTNSGRQIARDKKFRVQKNSLSQGDEKRLQFFGSCGQRARRSLENTRGGTRRDFRRGIETNSVSVICPSLSTKINGRSNNTKIERVSRVSATAISICTQSSNAFAVCSRSRHHGRSCCRRIYCCLAARMVSRHSSKLSLTRRWHL